MNEKKKLLPDLKKFDDIFSHWEDTTDEMRRQSNTWLRKKPTRDKMEFSTFCKVEFAREPVNPKDRQFVSRFYRVEAKPEIEKLIIESTIHIEYDTMNFNIVDWHDGTSLVTCNHSAILGGVWLCLIDNASIPRVPWA